MKRSWDPQIYYNTPIEEEEESSEEFYIIFQL